MVINSFAKTKDFSLDTGLPPKFIPLLTQNIKPNFCKNGFAVVEDGLSKTEVDQLRKETAKICRGELGQVAGLPPSAPEENSYEVLERVLCVHFPYKISQIMFDILFHPVIVDNLTKIIGPNVKCMQQMLFIKSSGMPGQAWHQD